MIWLFRQDWIILNLVVGLSLGVWFFFFLVVILSARLYFFYGYLTPYILLSMQDVKGNTKNEVGNILLRLFV